jgi:L-serine dehydratase
MYSIFDLFKVGVGPSSSHTVGPMIAAYRFAHQCLDMQHEKQARIAQIQVELFGSLALTGAGHATDTAIFAGLSGYLPDRTSPEVIQQTAQRIRSDHKLHLADQLVLDFDPKQDLKWLFQSTLPQHPNAMQFRALNQTGQILIEDQYFSTGGGFVYSRTEFDQLFPRSSAPRSSESVPPTVAAGTTTPDSEPVPFPFKNAKELIDLCKQHQISIDALVEQNELTRRTQGDIESRLDHLWQVMSLCIESGCLASGLLPGSLKVPRRAPDIYRKLTSSRASECLSKSNDIGDLPVTSMLYEATRHTSHDPLQQLDWVSLFALAVNEENAAGGRVVTAPTNGAAGVIPAVLAYYVYFYPGATRQGVHRFLKTAAAIGLLYKRNASLSAAEMGCQGEVGVACSMAAAGLAACMGGTVDQIENAAEIGMEHNLGLTCDPIAGLVQVPCIERNTMGATKAINAARLAVLYGDGKHFVSLDRVIETMRQTGVDMQVKYKETSLGGLAVNVVDC